MPYTPKQHRLFAAACRGVATKWKAGKKTACKLASHGVKRPSKGR